MEALNIFLSLLARTEGRDKVLRLVQYATLHSVDDKVKGSTYKIYEQVRMTRKLLRFLRSLEYSTKIREQLPKLKNSLHFPPAFLKYLTGMLQNLFTILFFLSDHRVCLGELGVIDRKYAIDHFPKSMKYYFLQNIFGAIHNLIKMGLQILKGKQVNEKQSSDKIKSFAFDLIRCVLNCFVALYYWKGQLPAKKVGIIGVITSVMAIMQSIGLI